MTDTVLRAGLPAAVLWDLDGTIVDSEDAWRIAAEEILARFGLAMSEALAEALIGSNMDVAAQHLAAAGVQLPEPLIVTELIDRVTQLQGTEAPPWRVGAVALLAELVGAGVPLALVTMSYRAMAEAIVGRLPVGTFTVIVAGDDVEHGKPHPEAYLAAAAALGVDPVDCVVFEDSLPGLTAAVSAGATAVAIAGPHPLTVPGVAAYWDTFVGRTLADIISIERKRS